MSPVSFDGCWTNLAGEAVTIEGDRISWARGPAARLVRRGAGEVSAEIEDMGDFHARLDAEGHLVWSDGDVWARRDAACEGSSQLALTSEQRQREVAAAESRQRIADAGGIWHKVLGVAPSASAEDVKHSFQRLALLHHPDKGFDHGDSETFRIVQGAYEEGLRRSARAAEGARAADLPVVPVVPSGSGLQVHPGAPKKQLRETLDRWEHAFEAGKAEHICEDVQTITVEELAELLLEGRCVPIDVRQPEEKYGSNAEPIPGAVVLGYMSLLKSPETVAPQIADLQRRTGHGGDGGHVVCYSTHGGSTGTCASVCCALMDVFGFSFDGLYTLEDGYLGWHSWRSQHRDTVKRMPAAA